MNTPNCAFVRDRLPELRLGRLDDALAESVRGHLSGCDDCRAELALLETLQRHPLDVPPELERRIAWAVRHAPRTRLLGYRALAYAASIAVAILGGSLLLREGSEPVAPSELADTESATTVLPPIAAWPTADGLLAGGALLGELSEEELELLLKEMDS